MSDFTPNDLQGGTTLQWSFSVGCDIRNSTVSRQLDGRTAEIYKFQTPVDVNERMPRTAVLRLNPLNGSYQTVAMILWTRDLSESIVAFVPQGTQQALAELRLREFQKPNSSGRHFYAGGSQYKWSFGARKTDDLACVQVLQPWEPIAYFEGGFSRLTVFPDGEIILDHLIVTLMLNLYFREINMW